MKNLKYNKSVDLWIFFKGGDRNAIVIQEKDFFYQIVIFFKQGLFFNPYTKKTWQSFPMEN